MNRKVVARSLLIALPLAFNMAAAGASSTAYSRTIFKEAPEWANWAFSIGAAVACAGFSGPAAIGCGLAAAG
jgi:hypothetical protein